jgi:uncharacterized protein (TIGR03032 family)
MSANSSSPHDNLLHRHDKELREPTEILACWQDAHRFDPRIFEFEVTGDWWDILASLQTTLFISREYEHLLLALNADVDTGPMATWMRVPHPSGIVFDEAGQALYVASTRNPNAIYDLRPITGLSDRRDTELPEDPGPVLMPTRIRFYPGCLYMHDLAMIGDSLYANSVGQNAVVLLDEAGGHTCVWWPECIETPDGPMFGRNHLQLNSIAAGDSLDSSFYSASIDHLHEKVPGDPDFPVDGTGLIFSGETRRPVVRGLTRPHSARFHRDRLWVDNSGYGEVGFTEGELFSPVAQLPGWTRGLAFVDDIAFVGTSRVLPRFTQYAPGLEPEEAVCGVHAIDAASGRVLGSIVWPYGNQIFAVEPVPKSCTTGLPFRSDTLESGPRERSLFYGFQAFSSREE